MRVQQVLAERLGDLGLTVDLWPLDLDARAPADAYPGEEVDRTAGWGLVAVSQPGEDVGLVLSKPRGRRPARRPRRVERCALRAGRVRRAPARARRLRHEGRLAASLAAVAALGPDLASVPPFAVHCTIGERTAASARTRPSPAGTPAAPA